MARYIGKRLLMGVVTMFVLITVTFFLVRLMPGTPFDISNVSQAIQDRMMTYYGLDAPVWEQYIHYLGNIAQGDLGISYKKIGTTVNQLIAMEAPYTIKLGVISYGVSLVLGIALGIWMAAAKKESVKGLLLTGTTLGISIPNYVLALVLMLVFGVSLKWFPVVGLASWKHYVLPVVTLAVYPIAQISQLVKSSYSEALQQDYVTMARAKGLSRSTISIRHILKNALLPVITISGPMIAFLITGSFVVEDIFTIPGIGREFVNAVSNRDYTVIMGLTIFIGFMIVVCNLISDIICALVDPRMKMDE